MSAPRTAASRVRVAIVQQPPAVLDLAAGVHRAAAAVADAAADGAQLVVFPETWLTGYPAWVFGLAGWDDAEARRWYGRLLAMGVPEAELREVRLPGAVVPSFLHLADAHPRLVS